MNISRGTDLCARLQQIVFLRRRATGPHPIVMPLQGRGTFSLPAADSGKVNSEGRVRPRVLHEATMLNAGLESAWSRDGN